MKIFKFKQSKQSGFSLVELMVVVGIIGILAGLALPKLQIFMAKAKTSEAKGALHQVYTLMQSYYTDNSTYATATLALIGYVQNGKYYGAPTFTAQAATTFTAQSANVLALCNGVAVGGDTWTITDVGTVTETSGTLTCN